MGADIDARNDPKHAKLLQDAMSGFISSTSYLAQSLPLYKIYPTPAFKNLTMYWIQCMKLDTCISTVRIEESAEKGEEVYMDESP